MSPKRMLKAILKAIRTRQTMLILGAPGLGKSTLVRQAAAIMKKELGVPEFRVVDVRTNLYQPVDVKGMPVVDLKEMITNWTRADFFRMVDPAIPGVLLFDEITAARPEVQASFYEAFLDRRIGPYEIPESWAIIAAGNRAGIDRSVAFEMPAALRMRCNVQTLEPSADEWREWAFDNGIDARIISFMKLRPQLLMNFDPQTKANQWANPRGWEMVSKALGDPKGTDPDIEFDYFAGMIGEAAATEFVGALRLWDKMPDPEDVYKAPATVDIPTDPSILFALSICLARTVAKATAAAFFRFADRLTGDFSVMMVSDAVRRDAALMKTSGFIAWAAAHKDVTF